MTGIGVGAGLAFKGSVGVSEFNPDDIPNLVEDWDAAATQTLVIVGGLVTQWDGKKNGTRLKQAAATKQPAFQGNKIYFDGVDDYLATFLSVNIFDNLNEYTIAILAQCLDSNNQSLFAVTNTSHQHGVLTELNAAASPDHVRFLHRVPYGVTPDDDLTKDADFTTQSAGIICRRSATRHGIIVDGGAETYITPADGALSAGHYIIAGNTVQDISVVRYFNGTLRRILAYSRAITDAEVFKITQLFNSLK